jgi:hypothetical protein
MTNLQTLLICCRKTRTFQNIQKNPDACLVVVATDQGHPLEREGCRLYLHATRTETKGKMLGEFKKQAAQAVGAETSE